MINTRLFINYSLIFYSHLSNAQIYAGKTSTFFPPFQELHPLLYLMMLRQKCGYTKTTITCSCYCNFHHKID